jgi:hypothetical protein
MMNTRTTNPLTQLKAAYCQAADSIIERAAGNRRRLSAYDLKQLKELNKAIKDLDLVVMPDETLDKLKRLREEIEDGRLAYEAACNAEKADKT